MNGPVEIRWPTARQATLLPGVSRGWLAAVEGPIGVGKTTLARRLSQLVEAYHVFFESFDGAPVIRVDTDHLDIREERGLDPVARAVAEARQ